MYKLCSIEGRKFVYVDPAIDVWTPSGYRKAPRLVSVYKMLSGQSLVQDIEAAEGMDPKERVLTSGESYQIWKTLMKTNPDIGETMVSGPCERTSTLADTTEGHVVMSGRRVSQFEGRLLQGLEADGEGGLKAKDAWPMAIPMESGYIIQLGAIFNRFIDTIYGMENARDGLECGKKWWYVFLTWPNKPGHMINVLRGRPNETNPLSRLESIGSTGMGATDPYLRYNPVCSRTAIDVDDATIEELLKKAVWI